MKIHPTHTARADTLQGTAPKVIAWEITRKCPLKCKHCRAAAENSDYRGELDTGECMRVVDGIASWCTPLIILTGGEPMTRPDLYELAAYATEAGLPVVMAPCGHLVNPDTAQAIKRSGIKAISISLDGKDAETHDRFRGVAGAYDTAVAATRTAGEAGLAFQVNATITQHNVEQLPDMLEKAITLGAMAFDVFFLVPTGRGVGIGDQQLSPRVFEQALNWIYDRKQEKRILIRTTCGPHYARIERQRAQASSETPPARFSGMGCTAGHGFIFISHQGTVQPCGFLDLTCGDLRENGFDLRRIYGSSEVLAALRNKDLYQGKCGTCEYWSTCGGCRARAYEHSGSALGSETRCVYAPERARS